MRIPVLLTLLALLGWTPAALAQTDTTFWFVAPDVTSASDGGSLDRPVVLRCSAFGRPSTVRITEPANPAFVPYTVTVPANQTVTVDLTAQLAQIENQPAGVVLNYGLHLSATAPITAYYEITSACGCNGDIFPLKGRNALGTEFYVPFQTTWPNSLSYVPQPRSSIDVVATEDNTVVTIVPTAVTTLGTAGTPLTATLQRGQTYSVFAASPNAADHLAGSRVVSTRPVAVTLDDDDVEVRTLSCAGADLIGDQLVPVSRLGTEYIIVKGTMAEETAVIVATQANTLLYVNGSLVPTAALGAGQTHSLSLTTAATFLRATAPVGVLHVSGGGCEVGGAVLPPITCTGSRQVPITRSTAADELFLNLIAPAGAQGGFLFNGQAGPIPAAAFAPVPGTNGQWLAAHLPLTLAQLPVGASAIVSNTAGVFHMGFLQGRTIAPGGGYRYGYFSDFNSLRIDLGPDLLVCPGTTAPLIANGGRGATYLWNTGATDSIIVAAQPGTYWVRIERDGCQATDTIRVRAQPLALQLTTPVDLCPGATAVLQAQAPNALRYRWSTGDTTATTTVGSPGTYFVTITTTTGCQATDSIRVVARPAAVQLPPAVSICPGASTVLQPVTANARRYLWSTGDTTATLTVRAAGTYAVSITNTSGCVGRDSTVVTLLDPSRDLLGPDTALCEGERLTLRPPNLPGSAFLWNTGSRQPTIDVDQPGLYWVLVTQDGCTASDSVVMRRRAADPTIANIITPNGDAYNQTLVIQTPCPYRWRLKVFNRWGAPVFESADYRDDWSAPQLTDGFYYYLAENLTLRKTYKGWVEVVGQ